MSLHTRTKLNPEAERTVPGLSNLAHMGGWDEFEDPGMAEIRDREDEHRMVEDSAAGCFMFDGHERGAQPGCAVVPQLLQQ